MDTKRRILLENVAHLALKSSSTARALFGLQLANAVASANVIADTQDYKALVCVFLFGGNDSYNMLIPTNEDEFKRYKSARSSLALALEGKQSAQPLKHSGVSGRNFATHPAIGELRDLYHKNELSFIANVGTLVEPITVNQYKKDSVPYPKALFSHNDQRALWQAANARPQGNTGWLGRVADIFESVQTQNNFSINFSVAGNNLLQTGVEATPYTISAKGSELFKNPLFNELFSDNPVFSNRSESNRSFFESEYTRSTEHSLKLNQYFSKIFGSTSIKTIFPPNSDLASSLKAIAKTIASRKQLEHTRQTYFILANGYDTHQNQLTDHPVLLADLSQSLSAFFNSLKQLEVEKNVTTFTISEFGRTLRSNGNGSDHGWGGNSLVMGGAVKGGRIYGEYPESLDLGGEFDVDKNGRILPTTSCDEYFAELLLWFGVTKSQLAVILPNIQNFYNLTQKTPPLGFMNLNL